MRIIGVPASFQSAGLNARPLEKRVRYFSRFNCQCDGISGTESTGVAFMAAAGSTPRVTASLMMP